MKNEGAIILSKFKSQSVIFLSNCLEPLLNKAKKKKKIAFAYAFTFLSIDV